MKKIKNFTLLILLFLVMCAIACNSTRPTPTGVLVTYELEGGTYQNCVDPVQIYYRFKNEGPHLIKTLTEITEEEVLKTGYEIEGWYTTKIENGDTVTYENKWDFSSDMVDENGITLYIKWVPKIVYTYEICYLDEQNEKVSLGEYRVSAGTKFSDRLDFASDRDGYTPIDYFDEEGNLWDENFRHPGGETSTTIYVIVSYIKGNYSVVKEPYDLLMATKSNIYLYNDIDMGGSTLSFGGYNNFTFLGNGHKISNFSIAYSSSKNALIKDYLDENLNSLSISLFGDCKNSTIKDVNFENVSLNVSTNFSMISRIYVAPISVKATNCVFENISFTGAFGYSELPDNDYFNNDLENSFQMATTSACIFADEDSVQTGMNINITNTNV